MNAETALLEVLNLDKHLIPENYRTAALPLIDHNECGLAYDLLVHAIQTSAYHPTDAALTLIKHAATDWGGSYPNLSC